MFLFLKIVINSIAYEDSENYICIVKNYLSRIFAIYVLLLALIPCSAVCSASVYSDDKLHIEQSSSKEHHNDDLCSPLCICLCCNYVTTVSDKFVYEHFKIQSTFNQTEYQHFFHHFLESDSPPPKS